jgi:hypothetical protein
MVNYPVLLSFCLVSFKPGMKMQHNSVFFILYDKNGGQSHLRLGNIYDHMVIV